MLGINVRSIRKIGTIARAWDSSMANASQRPWSFYFSHSQRCRAGRFWSHCIFVKFVRSRKDVESQTAKNQGSDEVTVIKSSCKEKSMLQGIQKCSFDTFKTNWFCQKVKSVLPLILTVEKRRQGKLPRLRKKGSGTIFDNLQAQSFIKSQKHSIIR